MALYILALWQHVISLYRYVVTCIWVMSQGVSASILLCSYTDLKQKYCHVAT